MEKLEQFNIYFQDLNEATQHYLCDRFKTTSEKENWDILPLVVLRRKVEEKEKD